MPERASGLRHHTELDFAGEIEWRREDIGNDRGDLVKGLRKCCDPHTSVDEHEIIRDERPKTLPTMFCSAVPCSKAPPLGVFAQVGERKAEVGLHVPTLKIQIDERASDQAGNQCPQPRIQQGDPETEAWQDYVGAGTVTISQTPGRRQRRRARKASRSEGSKNCRCCTRDRSHPNRH